VTRRILRNLLLASVAGALFLGVARPAHAELETNIWLPFSIFARNPCTYEFVEIADEAHMVIRTDARPDGSFHQTVHLNLQGSGIGDQSTTYSASLIDQLTQNIQAGEGGQGAFTHVTNFVVVSHGSACNISEQAVIHVTVNASGQVTGASISFAQ
jgi:hypothetical protein